MTASAKNNQMAFGRLVNVLWIPDMMGIVGNGFLHANLASTFLPRQGFKPYILPFVRLQVAESVRMFGINAHKEIPRRTAVMRRSGISANRPTGQIGYLQSHY
jgi:hypothetical protein